MASQLPEAISTYVDSNGSPLAGGFLFYYIPGTTTAKTVWADAAQTLPLSNPIILNGAGQPTNGTSSIGVFGTGTYRQIVQDNNGNQIWDAVTTDPNSAPGSASIAGDLTVGGALTVTGATALAAVTATSANIQSGVQIGTTVTVGSNATIGGSVTIAGASTTTGLAAFNGAQSNSSTGYLLTNSGVFPYTGLFFASAFFQNTAVGQSFYATSDERIKTDWHAITPEDGERFVSVMDPYTYLKDGVPEAGFSAQKRLAAGYSVSFVSRPGLPERQEPDGSVSPADRVMVYSKTDDIAFLTAALKGAFARISALERLVTDAP